MVRPDAYERVALVNQMDAIKLWLPADSVVVAEHGLQYLVTASTGHRASRVSTLENVDPSTRYWLLRSRKARRLVPPKSSLSLAGWRLVRQDELVMWLRELNASERALVCADNPQHAASDSRPRALAWDSDGRLLPSRKDVGALTAAVEQMRSVVSLRAVFRQRAVRYALRSWHESSPRSHFPPNIVDCWIQRRHPRDRGTAIGTAQSWPGTATSG